MASRRRVDNTLALAVLCMLVEAPMHPYEMGRLLRERGDVRSIKFSFGSLYTVVRQLAKAGFVAEDSTTREGLRPERTVYTLTEAGRTEMRDWLSELIEVPRHEYPHFVTALSLASALQPDHVAALLRARLDTLAAERAGIRTVIDDTLAAGVPPLFVVEEEYRLTMLDAEVAFIERLVQQITDHTTGWVQQWREFHHATGPTRNQDT